MAKKKTLLLLGGSSSQTVAIERAKDFGYRTVLCDYLPDNPGRTLADVFYQVSTTDLEGVLRVAQEEGASGIVAYGSDPAAPTASYVAERLGLPAGVPYETAHSFCEKHLFREFLGSHGFACPPHFALSGDDGPVGAMSNAGVSFPVVVKPSDSSGSKGVEVVRDASRLAGAVERARGLSRDGVAEVEGLVEADHEGVVEAEVFVWGGEVVSWGLMRCLRDPLANPLLPAGYRHPLDMGEARVRLVKDEISRLVREGGVRFGAMNIEMAIDTDGRLFFLDVGPRNGGNMLPRFLSLASGQDLVGSTLRCAMGEKWDQGRYEGDCDGAWYMHVLHSRAAGRLSHVGYSGAARGALAFKSVFLSEGDEVRPFRTSLDVIGLAMFRFGSPEELDSFLVDVDEHVRVELG